MQTPAEKFLVSELCETIESETCERNHIPTILNIGAGKSLSIERQLLAHGLNYVADRIDIDDCNVDHPNAGRTWISSVEDMSVIGNEQYKVAFANYVLEHVPNIRMASREIYRIIQSGGIFVTSVPNPQSPEFSISHMTPTRLHKLVRQQDAWDTHYAYGSISELAQLFEDVGFRSVEVQQWPFVTGYLHRYPIVSVLGRVYDKCVCGLGFKRLMGDACLIVRK